MSLSKVVSDVFQAIFDKLPQQVQRVILLPSVRKGLAFLAAWKTLGAINSYISYQAQNNWIRLGPWDPSKELVVLTGGCSGIGKQILEDLTKLNVKVIILDVQDPNFELRMSTHHVECMNGAPTDPQTQLQIHSSIGLISHLLPS
jgi:hypothetical protein